MTYPTCAVTLKFIIEANRRADFSCGGDIVRAHKRDLIR